MDPIVGAVLGVLMRWVHITSVVMLLGGVLYARLVVAPALKNAPASVGEQIAENFRPWLLLTIVTILVSGLYNIVTKPNIPPGYFVWFGIKMLLALHILSVSFLLARASLTEERRNRLLTGVAISGVAVTMISAWLRFLTNWMRI
jgi:uncharacterized membrane protein